MVVHGAPGAGKSTLARALGWADRDWSIRVGGASWELLVRCVERLVGSGVSLIAEGNFRPADPSVPRLRSLGARPGVLAVEVDCTARYDLLWERFRARRAAGGRHPGHVGFDEREEFLLDLERRIEVDTSDRWPAAADVAPRIRAAVGQRAAG